METETPSYFLLGSAQGPQPEQGWRRLDSSGLELTADGIRLAPAPVPPVPLKDANGTFGGLQSPTGIVAGADGTLYVCDARQHRIYKVVRRDALAMFAHFFLVADGRFAGDRFVFVPTAQRLERWPASLRRDPERADETEIICETAWDEITACRAVLAFLAGRLSAAGNKPCCAATDPKQTCECGTSSTGEPGAISKEWDAPYPASLPCGTVCSTTIVPLPCLGGLGNKPRQFNEPRGLALSPVGNLIVADSKNHRVQVFALQGLGLKAIWGRRASTKDAVSPAPGEDCLPDDSKTVRVGQPIAGSGLGEFNTPWDVAADGEGNIFIADTGNDRVQRFDCRTRRFSEIKGTVLAAHFFLVLYGPQRGERLVFLPALRRLERWPRGLGRDPQNAAETQLVSDQVSSLDAARTLALKTVEAAGSHDIFAEWDAAYPETLRHATGFRSPTHLAVDNAGRLYVVDAGDVVTVLDRAGRVCDQLQFRDEAGGRFQPSSIAVDSQGRLLLGDDRGVLLLDPKARGGRRYSASAWRCDGIAAGGAGELFVIGDFGGVAQLPAPAAYVKDGVLLAGPLDSDIDRCQWHRLVLNFSHEIPAGTRVTVWTYADNELRTLADIGALSEADWQTGQSNADDFLVLSSPGRFLWLKIQFEGNGADTPQLRNLKAHFPRVTYLEYLPAVYQADPFNKDFLERFLSLFETEVGGFEQRISTLPDLLDADGAPAGDSRHDFLSWLARWVDMSFEAGWSVETRRRLLRHAPELYRRRGTPAGLKMFLRLALDLDVRILENFQVRRWLFLGAQSTLGDRSQLWGNCIVSRLQLDENSRIGEFALVGVGDPPRDPFRIEAHKFSVFLPAARLRDETTERLVRHLIEQEKPAHTQFDLVKVQPRFRVGMQATIGLDTQVGAYPRLTLNCCATLGYDTLLSCASPRVPGWSRRQELCGEAPWQSCTSSHPGHRAAAGCVTKKPCLFGASATANAPRAFQLGERSRVGVNAVVG